MKSCSNYNKIAPIAVVIIIQYHSGITSDVNIPVIQDGMICVRRSGVCRAELTGLNRNCDQTIKLFMKCSVIHTDIGFFWFLS